MEDRKRSLDKLLTSLQERAKELDCYYQIQKILKNIDEPIKDVCRQIICTMPPGWQYMDICRIKITLGNSVYCSPDFAETPWYHSDDIIVDGKVIGSISVYYTKETPEEDEGPFLKGEFKLLQTICEQFGNHLEHRRTHESLRLWDTARSKVTVEQHGEWRVVLSTFKQSAPQLYQTIAHKMLNHLCWNGVPEVDRLLRSLRAEPEDDEERVPRTDQNFPRLWKPAGLDAQLSAEIFDVAADNINSEDILRLIQKWLQEDKLRFLMKAVNTNIPSPVVADMIHRYYRIMQEPSSAPTSGARAVLFSLIRRFLSDQKEYIKVAKQFISITDFHFLLKKVILGSESRGKLGGKGAGLYLARQILAGKSGDQEVLKNVRVPKTWYITSDVLIHFIHYNNFDEVIEQKYKSLKQIRVEHPFLVQSFKGVSFPPDIITGLSMALDDFGNVPLIVRSSSLLEDSTGAAFPGKYKSIFLVNQGSKRRRLEALTNAIAEVYASTFGPDAIEYRVDRDLLDFIEEMGIVIQEVVGRRFGKYYLPLYAGAAFSCNEYLWSPRIRREDGLVRMVPGLGTRAVDRLSDDYPVMISPGQPNLRTTVTPDEIIRYSPRMMDVINLDTGDVETVDCIKFFKSLPSDVPAVSGIVSCCRGDQITELSMLNTDANGDDHIVTFNGLVSRTPFIPLIRSVLTALSEALHVPVNIEFASDGNDFYLLQCRAQSQSKIYQPAVLPTDIPADDILFTADRHICNGQIEGISHIVYVVPEKYGELPQRADLLAVGKAIGRLNRILPRRKFILMGPGRWGSKGDIRLGVSVDYADINNTSMLIEVARSKDRYVPELSFGTHFFQDLVESQIRYLPLYADNEGVIFQEEFLLSADNRLSELLPDCAALSDTIRVIDLGRCADGKSLVVGMNAEAGLAMAYLVRP